MQLRGYFKTKEIGRLGTQESTFLSEGALGKHLMARTNEARSMVHGHKSKIFPTDSRSPLAQIEYWEAH